MLNQFARKIDFKYQLILFLTYFKRLVKNDNTNPGITAPNLGR